MKASELESHEQLALLGLLKLIVRADRHLSDEETGVLKVIAEEMGDAWGPTLEKARVEIKTASEAKGLADKVVRVEARQMIVAQLLTVAGSDDLVPEEAAIIDWLRTKWDMPA